MRFCEIFCSITLRVESGASGTVKIRSNASSEAVACLSVIGLSISTYRAVITAFQNGRPLYFMLFSASSIKTIMASLTPIGITLNRLSQLAQE